MTRILVVDDEAALAVQLKERLTKMGYEVVGKASSGEAAIEMARRFSPDLVFMDIVLPGKIDGIKAAEVINENLDIPIVFVTGHASNEFINPKFTTQFPDKSRNLWKSCILYNSHIRKLRLRIYILTSRKN